MKKGIEKGRPRSNAKERVQHDVELVKTAHDPEGRMLLIQRLIPLGLMVVEEELQAEVTRLVGARYSRDSPKKRWGYHPGSVFLGDQKLSIRVPRVRQEKAEVELESYRRLQNPQVLDGLALSRVLNGISMRQYERAVAAVPETFGMSKRSVSRKFVTASGQQLQAFIERDLSDQNIIAIIMDGKTFAETAMITALGVNLSGEKIILGFIEAATENAQVCQDFLHQLKERGLQTQEPILFVIDGAPGLAKAMRKVFGNHACIQRCQWHKRENVVAYLPSSLQEVFRKKIQQAYEQPTYEKAKRKLQVLHKELQLLNQSAAQSLLEGLEETLTLHRLGLYQKLGVSLKTTNCIESLHSQVEGYTGRIKYWKNSSQRQRWVATAFLQIEPKFRRIKGYRHLKSLQQAMKKNLKLNQTKAS